MRQYSMRAALKVSSGDHHGHKEVNLQPGAAVSHQRRQYALLSSSKLLTWKWHTQIWKTEQTRHKNSS